MSEGATVVGDEELEILGCAMLTTSAKDTCFNKNGREQLQLDYKASDKGKLYESAVLCALVYDEAEEVEDIKFAAFQKLIKEQDSTQYYTCFPGNVQVLETNPNAAFDIDFTTSGGCVREWDQENREWVLATSEQFNGLKVDIKIKKFTQTRGPIATSASEEKTGKTSSAKKGTKTIDYADGIAGFYKLHEMIKRKKTEGDQKEEEELDGYYQLISFYPSEKARVTFMDNPNSAYIQMTHMCLFEVNKEWLEKNNLIWLQNPGETASLFYRLFTSKLYFKTMVGASGAAQDVERETLVSGPQTQDKCIDIAIDNVIDALGTKMNSDSGLQYLRLFFSDFVISQHSSSYDLSSDAGGGGGGSSPNTLVKLKELLKALLKANLKQLMMENQDFDSIANELFEGQLFFKFAQKDIRVDGGAAVKNPFQPTTTDYYLPIVPILKVCAYAAQDLFRLSEEVLKFAAAGERRQMSHDVKHLGFGRHVGRELPTIERLCRECNEFLYQVGSGRSKIFLRTNGTKYANWHERKKKFEPSSSRAFQCKMILDEEPVYAYNKANEYYAAHQLMGSEGRVDIDVAPFRDIRQAFSLLLNTSKGRSRDKADLLVEKAVTFIFRCFGTRVGVDFNKNISMAKFKEKLLTQNHATLKTFIESCSYTYKAKHGTNMGNAKLQYLIFLEFKKRIEEKNRGLHKHITDKADTKKYETFQKEMASVLERLQREMTAEEEENKKGGMRGGGKKEIDEITTKISFLSSDILNLFNIEDDSLNDYNNLFVWDNIGLFIDTVKSCFNNNYNLFNLKTLEYINARFAELNIPPTDRDNIMKSLVNPFSEIVTEYNRLIGAINSDILPEQGQKIDEVMVESEEAKKARFLTPKSKKQPTEKGSKSTEPFYRQSQSGTFSKAATGRLPPMSSEDKKRAKEIANLFSQAKETTRGGRKKRTKRKKRRKKKKRTKRKKRK